MVQVTRDLRSVWDFSDPAATEVRFRGMLGDNAIDNLCYQTQIARTLGLRDRFDEAHALLDTVDAEIAALADPTDVGAVEAKVRSLLERGRVFRSSKRPANARPIFLDAVAVAEQAQMDALAIDAMHMVVLVVDDQAESLQWSEKALQRALASDDPAARNWDAPLANNMGWTYHDAGNFTEAMRLFKIALAARERIGAPRPIQIGKWMIARAHRSLLEHADALAILHELEKLNNEDGFVSEELGENYEAVGQHETAKPYFARAYELLKNDSSVDAPRLARILALSQS
ncbi:Aste57867_24528 [Aphanomyces stellatus]|uniref:Aste57867_24528 protein n=1 Tax=Aphanomyces stellatus TaxID=120398 RepID=A0A485LQK7_9STRA|nr:hypothetical protein As57867_024451 [Aphanomyces stellatus]VFU01167.1 Aste57867_24528 [Aphanomyces stellatus]